MFDLMDLPLVWIPVKWPGLRQDDEAAVAVVVTHEIEIQVEILDRDAFGKWLAANQADAERDATDPAAELEIVKGVVKAWRRVTMKGKAVPFNDENLALLLRFPGFVQAFGAAYMKAWNGQAETRSGNSASSPANGPAGAA